jgi:hypothetical protein
LVRESKSRQRTAAAAAAAEEHTNSSSLKQPALRVPLLAAVYISALPTQLRGKKINGTALTVIV